MTVSMDIAKIIKWKEGNGQKGAAQTIIEHDKDIVSIKEDLKCKADAVTVENLIKQVSDMSKDIKTLLERSGSNVSYPWLITTGISLIAAGIAIIKLFS